MDSDQERRNKKIDFRVTEKEYSQIMTLCKKAKITRSAFILQSILNGKVLSSYDVQMIFQLRKIGVNVNQMAKQIHIISKFPDKTDYNLSEILNQLTIANNQLKIVNDHILGSDDSKN